MWKIDETCVIGHVRYINILTWLLGFRVKIVHLSFFCLSIPTRDLETKKVTPNIQVCPESLECYVRTFYYIERGLFPKHRFKLKDINSDAQTGRKDHKIFNQHYKKINREITYCKERIKNGPLQTF